MSEIKHQCQIWSLDGNVLRESAWVAAGFPTLETYVKSIIRESKLGLTSVGRDVNMFDKFPLCTFGWIDKDGTQTIALTCKDYNELPTETIKLGDNTIIDFDL